MKELQPTIRIRLWLEDENGDMIFGSGRSNIIENISKYGSLKKAAQAMRISYRAAWGKIKKTEEILGERLIEPAATKREGYHLTEYAIELNNKYRLWFDKIEKQALEESKEIFPWTCRQYKDTNK